MQPRSEGLRSTFMSDTSQHVMPQMTRSYASLEAGRDPLGAELLQDASEETPSDRKGLRTVLFVGVVWALVGVALLSSLKSEEPQQKPTDANTKDNLALFSVDGKQAADPALGSVSNIYVGCGCFWHVQHELVTVVEQKLLERTGLALTAFTGYAGSDKVGPGGHVCYHNWQGYADYGGLGYAEVVSLSMPDSIASKVAKLYFEDICVGGVREDSQDQGAEYRSLVGFPGGLNSPIGQAFKAEAARKNIKIVEGAGGDPDASGSVYVMDTARFPFHQAEVYHQFHDDMIDAYGTQYNDLRQELVTGNRIKATGCPSD